MCADEIRRAIEAADRLTLPGVTALLWRAYGEGRVTEAEAEALSELIEARTTPRGATRPSGNQPPEPDRARKRIGGPRTATGSRPRSQASLERRRRWAASGRLPPGLAARFTLAEQAVLALVAAETARRGDCRLAVGHLAAVAGVADTTVRNAVREARRLGLLTVEERRITGFRNDTNVVRIASAEWTAWLRLARRSITTAAGRPTVEGGGCKSANRTPTKVLVLADSGRAGTAEGCRRAAVDPGRGDRNGIRAGGGRARAMR